MPPKKPPPAQAQQGAGGGGILAEFGDPVTAAVAVVEKKARNLEKRKVCWCSSVRLCVCLPLCAYMYVIAKSLRRGRVKLYILQFL